MKNKNIKISTWHIVISIVAIAVAMMPASAHSEDLALLVQQSPVQGGTVTPEMGVHRFASGEEVVLTATPKPGYQFVYWLGDVSDTTNRRTAVYLNSPKIVIAVFERSKFEFLVTDELAQSESGGGLFHSAADYGNQGFSGGTAAINPSPIIRPQNNFPVPPPVPEPATILLLFWGCLGLVRKRRELQITRL